MNMLKVEEKYRIRKPREVSKTYEREKDLLTDCRGYLKTLDLFFRRVEGSGKVFGGAMVASDMKGFPDLLIVADGQLYCAELKVYGGHLTESQALCITGIAKAGGRAGVVLSLWGLKQMLADKPHTTTIATKHGEVMVWP